MRIRMLWAALLIPAACATTQLAPEQTPPATAAPSAQPKPVSPTESPVLVTPLPDLATRPITADDLTPYPRDWIEATRATLPSATFQTVVTGTVRYARTNEPVGGVRVFATSVDGAAPVYRSMHYHRGTLTDALLHPANPTGETVTAADGSYALELTVTGTGRIALQRLLRWLPADRENSKERITASFVVRADVPGAQCMGTVCSASLTTALAKPARQPDVLVDTGPWLTGRVVTGDTPEPVPGATIYVDHGSDFRSRTRSGKDGTFRVPAPSGVGNTRVSVAHDFGWARVTNEAPDGTPADRDVGDIVLLDGPNEGCVVEGRLVSEDPADDPFMYQIALHGRVNPEATTASTSSYRAGARVLSDGRFRIRWDYAGTFRLGMWHFPGGSQITEEFELRPGTVVNVGTIRMLSRKLVGVQVVDTDGNPIHQASVSAGVARVDHLDPTRFVVPEGPKDILFRGSGVTDWAGRFERRLPVTQLLYLSASHPEYLESHKTIDPASSATAVVVLSRGATICGVLSRDGSPIAERAVHVQRQTSTVGARHREDWRFRRSSTDGWQRAFAYTDKNGNFAMNRLAPGTYNVSYHHRENREVVPGHLRTCVETSRATILTVTGELTYEVEFDLPGDVSPSVTVNLNGNPCPGATAWLEPEGKAVYWIAYSMFDPDRKPPTTDERGRITLPDMPAGKYWLVVEARVEGSLVEYRQQVTLTPDNREFTVNLEPASRSAD